MSNKKELTEEEKREKEAKRRREVAEAIDKGLLNPKIVAMVEKFTSEHGIDPSSFIDGVANPGTKSAESLMSKIERKNKIEDDHSFTLAGVGDIVRCSIIVDSYEQVVALIKELQKKIPGLKGDISENDTGYKGIHLSFEIDGFKTEMQIATRDAWYVKQAGEGIYAKWRDFNLNEELAKLEAMPPGEEFEKARDALIEKIEAKEKDIADCREMFKTLHQNTDFLKYRDQINAVLYLNNNAPQKDLPPSVKDKYNVNMDSGLDSKVLEGLCQEFSDLAKPSQDKLISFANEALRIAKNTKGSSQLTHEEKTFVLLAQEYKLIMAKQLQRKYGDDFDPQIYVSKLNKISNERALATIEYCRKNGIKIDSYAKLDEVMNKVNGSNNLPRDQIAVKGMDSIGKSIQAKKVQDSRVENISSSKAA